MDLKESLYTIGLTKSEAKVYLALCKIGSSSKTNIIKESNIPSSKIYFVLDRLMKKGLVSKIIKKDKQFFSACPITRINDLLDENVDQINKQKELVKSISGKISSLQRKEETNVEVFFGWKGLETVYSSIIKNSVKDQEVLIMGASRGFSSERSKEFFIKYGKAAFSKRLKIKVIFNKDSKNYVKEIEKEAKIKYSKRFLDIQTPTEITITNEYSVIIIMKEDPIVILIKDNETSLSFKEYFNELWKYAKS